MNMLLRLGLVAPLLLLTACASIEPADLPTMEANDAELRLYVLDCGRIRFDDVSAFGLSNNDTPVRELFVPCYLVRHSAGDLLFDLGLPLDAVGQGEIHLESGAIMRYERSLLEQLNDLGLAPADVDKLAISHAHFDHVGAANAFTESEVLMQEAEYQAAFLNAGDNPVFVPALYSAWQQLPLTRISGDHDVFSDGSVQLISAPGHTPGHQTLLLELANYGPLMLSGDLYHFEASRMLNSVPSFNTDREATLASMRKIESLLKRTGATLWIEHNLVLAESLERAPAYYD